MVKTSPSYAGGLSLISGQGVKIPHASWSENQNTKQKQFETNSIKNFKR